MSALEKNVAKLYEDIHPFIDVEQTIDDYLETLRIGPEFFKGKNILDCGFGGTGWAVELFARAGAQKVTGIDLNPKWSERIAQRLSNYRHELDLRAGTVLELPFQDNTFDYVHSHGVMHHTTDWKKGVQEMTRVVRPGGTIYLMLYGKFAPVGRLIHFCYRTAGKIIPYAWTAAFVNKTGIYQDHELSLLDAMYVPIEEHLSAQEIREHLEACGMINIRFFESAKWKKRKFYSSHLMFGANIQNVVWADKPL
jgi:ubiquinone/menaquinone biosynthesis C-methylase UbiE